MSKTLILCHVEEMFRKHFPPGMLDAIVERSDEFDRIIHMTSYIENNEPVIEIRGYMDEDIEWGWGYEWGTCYDPVGDKCTGKTCEECWTIPSNGHEATWVPPELRNGRLVGTEVFIGGGYDGECLADLEAVLDHLNVPYQREREFIYP